MTSKVLLAAALCLSTTIFSQQSKNAVKDPTVTNFFRRTTGWVASDGGITIPLSDHRKLWLMGDSHIDDYDSATGTVAELFQVRNAALLQPAGDWDWHHTQTLIGGGPGSKNFLKNNPDDQYFTWPAGGIQLKDTVYVYCANMKNAKSDFEGFGFAHAGIDYLAKIKFPDMKVVGYENLQDFDEIAFGSGFIKKGEWVYVYGQKLKQLENQLYVARFKANAPESRWAFWTGSDWSADITAIRPIATQSGVEGTFEVCAVKDRVLLVSSELSVGCDQGKAIYTSISDKVTGPFPSKRKIYTIDDTVRGHYPFFYLAAAHPEYLDEDKRLLFTYSINGYGRCLPESSHGRFNADYYRLKAFRVPLETIGIR